MCHLPTCFPCLQSQRTPLHRAAESGGEEACKVLIEKGADVNARDEVMRRREGIEGRGVCGWGGWGL